MSGSGSLLRTQPTPTELGQVVRGSGVFTTTPGIGIADTSVVSRVAASATNVTLLAANAARSKAAIHNNSATQDLFVKLGATADIGAGTESFTIRMSPNDYYEVLDGYVGVIDGIWAAADVSGEALITELAP